MMRRTRSSEQTQTEKIAEKIEAFLRAQRGRGAKYVDLTARDVGQLAGTKARYPMCVSAMNKVAAHYRTELLHTVPSGQSSTVEIRYYLS